MEYITFKKSNCRNCHKCIRYCPVKSIRFSGNQANVISDECILCGECYVVCPQNAKQIADETEIVSVLLGSGAPVYASVAPSFTAYFNGIGSDMTTKLKDMLSASVSSEYGVGIRFNMDEAMEERQGIMRS